MLLLRFMLRSSFQCERRLAEEQGRVRTYLHSSTGPKLLDILQRLMIEDKAKTLLTVRAVFLESLCLRHRWR